MSLLDGSRALAPDSAGFDEMRDARSTLVSNVSWSAGSHQLTALQREVAIADARRGLDRQHAALLGRRLVGVRLTLLLVGGRKAVDERIKAIQPLVLLVVGQVGRELGVLVEDLLLLVILVILVILILILVLVLVALVLVLVQLLILLFLVLLLIGECRLERRPRGALDLGIAVLVRLVEVNIQRLGGLLSA